MTNKKSAGTRIVEFSVVLTLLGAITVLLRLAAVSRGDLDLAFALVHVSNFGEILLSTGLLMAPALTLFAVLAWEFQAIRVMKVALVKPGRDTLLRALAWFVGFSFALFIASIFQSGVGRTVLLVALAIVAVLAFMLMAFGARLVRQIRIVLWDVSKGRTQSLGVIGVIFIGLGGLGWILLGSQSILRFLIPSDQAWAHTEVVSFADREPHIGRVLSSDSEWTYLVIDDPRSLEIVPTTQIIARSVCSLDDSIDTVTDRLWTANTFGSVALSITFCNEELANREELFNPAIEE